MRPDIAALLFPHPARRLPAGDGRGEPGPDEPVLVRLRDVQPEAVEWLWPDRVAVGKLNLVIGDPGLGKSLLTLDMSARISRGTAWPDGGFAPQGNVILLSAEDGLGDTVRPRLGAAGADLDRVYVLRAVRDEAGERHFTLARDLDALEQAITRAGAVLVVIDPVSAYLGDKDSYKDSEVRALLAPLAALAERQRVAVVAVMHLTKDQQRRALYRALGSVAFVAAARVVLAVARDPEDPDRRMVVAVKNNLGLPAATLAFKITQTAGGPILAWERDPVGGASADDLLGPSPSPEEREERQTADGFLRELLASGEVAASDVFKAARAAGISERTLYRTKARLGVRARHEGQPGRPGAWWWSLPKTATHTEMAAFGERSEKKDETGAGFSEGCHARIYGSLRRGEWQSSGLMGGGMNEAALDLLNTLWARGVELAAVGDRLRFRPAQALTREEIEQLRACKGELLRLLVEKGKPFARPLRLDPTTLREVLGPTPSPEALQAVTAEVAEALDKIDSEIKTGQINKTPIMVRGRALALWLPLDEVARLLTTHRSRRREADGA